MYIWERQPKESIKAYEAFKIYLELGSKRSLKLVSKNLNKALSLIMKWSREFNWTERVFKYEVYIDKIKMEEKEKQIRSALEKHASISNGFIEGVENTLKSLNTVDFKKLNPLQLIKLFEIAVNLERNALGIAPVGEEVRIDQAQQRIEIYKEKIDSGKGANLQDSSPFITAIQNMAVTIWNSPEETDERVPDENISNNLEDKKPTIEDENIDRKQYEANKNNTDREKKVYK